MPRRRTHEFLQLTNTISYPPAKKAVISIAHSNLIEQVLTCFDGTKKTKEHIIHVINCITYMYTSKDSLPATWNDKDPLHTYTEYTDDFLEEAIPNYFIHQKDVDWVDVPIVSKSAANADTNTPIESEASVTRQIPKSRPIQITDVQLSNLQTPKSDLYIQPPMVPRFDTKVPVASGNVDGTIFAVYKSYPEVPTKQNEISATTDINMMTDSDLLKLFPASYIRTRAECMYTELDGITLDPKLGLLLPIQGYTEDQLRDNIIRYPHIFKLLKEVNGVVESFYSTIEIDGELHKISDVWKTFPEAYCIPYTKEFVKEYVVRRYLLERDIKGIEHRYKMYGTLDPFLTLFTFVDDYASMGYKDPITLARSCVVARVNYKKSRNPVLRRLSNV